MGARCESRKGQHGSEGFCSLSLRKSAKDDVRMRSRFLHDRQMRNTSQYVSCTVLLYWFPNLRSEILDLYEIHVHTTSIDVDVNNGRVRRRLEPTHDDFWQVRRSLSRLMSGAVGTAAFDADGTLVRST